MVMYVCKYSIYRPKLLRPDSTTMYYLPSHWIENKVSILLWRYLLYKGVTNAASLGICNFRITFTNKQTMGIEKN